MTNKATIPNDVKLFHIDHKLTIAAKVDENQHVLYFTEAKVHPGDHFCRKTGRIKAVGRLNSVKSRINCVDKPLFHEFRDQMFSAYNMAKEIETYTDKPF